MMAFDLPCVSYFALYMVSLHIVQSNSRTQHHHWKLNLEEGKVQAFNNVDSLSDANVPLGPSISVSASSQSSFSFVPDDPIFSLLTNKIMGADGEWRLESNPQQQAHDTATCSQDCHTATSDRTTSQSKSAKTADTKSNSTKKEKRKNQLDCGKAVNYTQYDHLTGISSRKSHPNIPEPEVAMIFKKKGSPNSEVDMNELEKRLRKLKKERSKSWHVFNQIGNFWRIKGNTQLSIECFRKALFYDPKNSDVLLNLARVLYNLQYLDDAILLTRRSLETQPSDQNAWLQHFTLGEILKAYGHYHEAALHFKHTLDLNPGFQPAQAHLREMESSPDATVTYYTLFIILFLVLGVLCGILTSLDSNFDDLSEGVKTQRHFNRAMAMRSIKLGINPKLIRMRKQLNNSSC